MVSRKCLSRISGTWNTDRWKSAPGCLLHGYIRSSAGRNSWYVSFPMRNVKLCLMKTKSNTNTSLHQFKLTIEFLFSGVYQCHDTGGNQEWTITKKGQIKHHDLCLTLLSFAKGSVVIMRICDDTENQKWELRDGGLLKHSKLNVCLDTRFVQENGITAERCNSGLDSQHWRFVSKYSWKRSIDYVKRNNANKRLKIWK